MPQEGEAMPAAEETSTDLPSQEHIIVSSDAQANTSAIPPASPTAPAPATTTETPGGPSAASNVAEGTQPRADPEGQSKEAAIPESQSAKPVQTAAPGSAPEAPSASTSAHHTDAPPQPEPAETAEPAQSAPSSNFDLAAFGENSLEAIAAAQIAAGLGDFDFSSATVDDNSQADATTAGVGNGQSAAVPAAALGDAQGPDATKNKPEKPQTELLDEFITTADAPQGSGTPATSARGAQSTTGPVANAPPVSFQKAFSTFTDSSQASNAGTAFNKGAPAAAEGAPKGTTSGENPKTSGPASASPAVGTVTAPNGLNGLPLTASTPAASSARPQPLAAQNPSGSSSPSVRPPQANANGIAVRPPPNGIAPRPMPPYAGGRPPPPRPGPPGSQYTTGPGGRPPPSIGGRPPAPALPASALFSQGPPGMPSFAALLGSLGPQDLAMVAHAAMGLDANGDPLPGNEESHRALADAMRKLRESAAVRPPPHMFRPPPYQQQHYQNGVPLPRPPPGQPASMPRPRPKMIKPRPMKPPKQPPQDAWILARAASEGGSVDALGKTGDPLQDKLPLIAGPRPDRAPPRGGPPPEKRFQCSKCDRAFARAYNLNTHFATHDPDPNRAKPFPCPYPSCKSEFRSFSRKHDLQRHIASTHEAEPEPIIEIADAETGETIQSNLAKLGLGAPGRKFRCECGRAFVRRDALRKHSCEAMRGQSMADLEASHSPSGDPRGRYLRGEGDEADALARRAAGLPAISGSGADLGGGVDFEALAASFAADAAQEMQAAQDHAARRGGDDEDEEDEEEEEEEDEDPDDAIANFASQLTAGAAAELGLTTSAGGEEDGGEGTADGVREGGAGDKSKTPQATEESGREAAAGEDNIDDAAAQYIAQLQSQLGGDAGAAEVPGLEGLVASMSGAPANEQQQHKQEEGATDLGGGQEQQEQQQTSSKRPSADAATDAQDAAASRAAKRVKREDEEYDQLGSGEHTAEASAPLGADTSIAA